MSYPHTDDLTKWIHDKGWPDDKIHKVAIEHLGEYEHGSVGLGPLFEPELISHSAWEGGDKQYEATQDVALTVLSRILKDFIETYHLTD